MNQYTKLVEKLGADGARAEMSRRAQLNKKPRYFATLDKEKLKQLSSRGGKHGKQTEESRRPS